MKLKFLPILFAIFATLVFTSCRVTLVPARSDAAIQLVQQTATATDILYAGMAASENKSYELFAPDYDSVSKQITQILSLDSSRKKSAVILIIANDIQKRFAKYQAEHQKAETLNEAEIRTYKNYMHALFSSLLNAENSFK